MTKISKIMWILNKKSRKNSKDHFKIKKLSEKLKIIKNINKIESVRLSWRESLPYGTVWKSQNLCNDLTSNDVRTVIENEWIPTSAKDGTRKSIRGTKLSDPLSSIDISFTDNPDVSKFCN